MVTLADLHNRYQDEELFILGTGPSFDSIPLELLRNKICFAVNSFMYKYRPPFTPRFYGIVETLERQTEETKKSLEIISAQWGHTLFLGDEARRGRLGYDHVFVPLNTDGEMREGVGWWERWANFSQKQRGMRGGTVALDLGVQVGYWMGFKTIYMLGCELTEERRKGYTDVILSRESAHMVAQKLAERDVKLVNLSEGSTADMPTQDWREVLLVNNN